MKTTIAILICLSAALIVVFRGKPEPRINPKFLHPGPLHVRIEDAGDIEVLDYIEAHSNGPVDVKEMAALLRRLPQTQKGILVISKLFLVSHLLRRTPESIKHVEPADIRNSAERVLAQNSRQSYLELWRTFLDAQPIKTDSEHLERLRATVRDLIRQNVVEE